MLNMVGDVSKYSNPFNMASDTLAATSMSCRKLTRGSSGADFQGAMDVSQWMILEGIGYAFGVADTDPDYDYYSNLWQSTYMQLEEWRAMAQAGPSEYPVFDGLTDGIYYGTAQGYSGLVTVQVTVEGGPEYGIMVDAEVIGDKEERPLTALEIFPERMSKALHSHAVAFDGITGATITSEAVSQAILKALIQATP
jgi:uncharacterized protein with FMN-binding domain